MNQKDWDDFNLKRHGTVFGEIARREDEQRRKELREIGKPFVHRPTTSSGSPESALGFIAAWVPVVIAVRMDVAWKWYGWVGLFLVSWWIGTQFFKRHPRLTKVIVLTFILSIIGGLVHAFVSR